MSYKRALTLLVLFLGGYAGVAAAGHDPTKLVWDWQAYIAGAIAAGLAQPALTDASPLVQIVSTVVAFFVGYGTIEDSTGWRYGMNFDWRALASGLLAAGLIHSNNQNVTGPVAQVAQSIAPKP